MTEQSFSLIPFPAPSLPNLTIKGTLFRQTNILTVHYALHGKIEHILLPDISATPMRKEELWKTTCFEFFLAVKNSPQYWEFNMSPSGDWNVYHMDAYRRIGFREEARIQHLPFEIQKDPNGLVLNVSVDLNPMIQVEQGLEIGITAIIQMKSGNETYWALLHPAPQADFHLRESFIPVTAG